MPKVKLPGFNKMQLGQYSRPEDGCGCLLYQLDRVANAVHRTSTDRSRYKCRLYAIGRRVSSDEEFRALTSRRNPNYDGYRARAYEILTAVMNEEGLLEESAPTVEVTVKEKELVHA